MRLRSLRRHQREHGASALEYAGLIVLAALILGALYSVIPGSLQTGVQRAVCTILRQGDCGAAPTGTGGGRGTVANGFTGGLVDGFTMTAAPPSYERAILPVQAQVAPLDFQDVYGPGGGNRGGDNSTEHNRVAADTKRLIEEKMGEYVTDGKVTIDCEPGGATANCIPGGNKTGNGGEGRADIMLTGKDKKTGKPVVYIWEVKPNTTEGREESVPQLDRYITQKQQQVGPGTEVRKGFGVPNSSGIPGNGNRVLNAWSESGDPTRGGNSYEGVRFYGGKERDKQRQKQPQEQPQPAPQPEPVPCGGGPPVALKAKKECPVPIFPGFPDMPGLPELPGLPFPEPVPVF